MSRFPVVDPPSESPAAERRVVGVLLAAGRSSRFGAANKLLATVDGLPVVRHAAWSLRQGTDHVVAVVGYEADRVRAAVEIDLGPATDVVENGDWHAGQGTSVAAGASVAADCGADAAVFALGDMPWISPDSVTALVDAYRAGQGDALAAAVDGKRGNPVLFDSRSFDALSALEGNAGGFVVFTGSDDAALVETGDPGIRRDVDRPSDLP